MIVTLVDKPTHPAVAATFEKISASGMRPVNLHRLLANSPEVFAKFIGFAHALRHETGLAPQDRELAILRVLENCRGHYELSHHRPMGLRAGLTEPQIDALNAAAGPDPTLFDERQRAILAFADGFSAGRPIDSATAATISQHFDDRGVVELAATMSLYLGLAHLTGALDLPLDQR